MRFNPLWNPRERGRTPCHPFSLASSSASRHTEILGFKAGPIPMSVPRRGEKRAGELLLPPPTSPVRPSSKCKRKKAPGALEAAHVSSFNVCRAIKRAELRGATPSTRESVDDDSRVRNTAGVIPYTVCIQRRERGEVHEGGGGGAARLSPTLFGEM